MRFGKSAGILAAAAWILITVGGFPAQADTLAQEQSLMNQLKQEASQTYSQIAAEKTKATSLHHSLADTQESLQNVQVAIANNQHDTDSVLAKIHTLDVAIHENQVKLDADKADLMGQVRAMYEGGPTRYLSVLFGSTSFHDFLSRIALLEIVAEKQKELVAQVTRLKASVQSERKNQQGEYVTLLQKRSQLQTFQTAQRILESQDRNLLADVSSNIQSDSRRNVLLESQIRLTQQQIDQIEAETRKAQELESNATYVQQQRASLAQVSSAPVITYAETFMGVPYVWGGTSPSGFDCSGFVQYVFAHFGVNLNRTSEDQFAEGVPVSTNDLQPGDLVFFSTYAPGASHVGIYMGNGMMIDAEDRGVTIDNVFNSYWGPKYIGARQILAQS